MDDIPQEELQSEIYDMGLDGYSTKDFMLYENSPLQNTVETIDLQFNFNELPKPHEQQFEQILITLSDTVHQSQNTKNLNRFLIQSGESNNLTIDRVINNETVTDIMSNYMLYYYPHLLKTHGIDYIMYLHYVSLNLDPHLEYRATHFAMPHLRDEHIHQHVTTSYRQTDPEKFWGYFCSDTLTLLYNGLFEKVLLSSYVACKATMTMLNKTIERQYENRRKLHSATFINHDNHKPIISYASCSISGHNACTTLAGNECYFNNTCIATSLLLRELTKSDYRCNNGNNQPHILILDLDAIHGNGTYQIMNHWETMGYINDNVKFISFQSNEIVEPYFLSYQTGDSTKLRDIEHEYSLSNYTQYLPINLGPNTDASHNINIPYTGVDPNSDYYQNFIRYLTLFCNEAIHGFAPDFIIISFGTNLRLKSTDSNDNNKYVPFSKEQYQSIGCIIGDIFINTPVTVIQETLTENHNDKVLHFLKGLRCDAQ